jgi:hypothetical protein
MTTGFRKMTAVATMTLGVAATTAPVYGRASDRFTSQLTFGGAIALPGVTLDAGTYVFERVFAGAPDVVVIRGIDGRKVYFMGTTQPRVRPAGMRPDERVVFGESRRGVPRPILAWYPRGAELGFGFVY